MVRTVSGPNSKPRWHGRVPITITLAAAIGSLVLVTVSVVFGIGVWTAQKNTFDLLRRNAEQIIAADVNQLRQHLRPAESQTQFIAERIAQGDIDPEQREEFGRMLVGSLAGAQQIEAVMFVDTDLQAIMARRIREDGSIELRFADRSADSIIQTKMASELKEPAWGDPIWRNGPQKSYLNRGHPVFRDGKMIGSVIAVTSIEGLSNFISEHGIKSAGHSFILYGEDEVLAHWQLIDGYPGRSNEHPLPMLDSFADPILASIWQSREEPVIKSSLPNQTHIRMLEGFNDHYVFVYRRLEGYGPKPMIVGAYFPSNNSVKEIGRMFAALVAGVIALLISLIVAIILGHRIARPIVRFSAAAARVQDLDVSKIEDLPGSVFRELNDQSQAFNAMLGALRWFELYVPKKIVERLIRHAEVHGTMSDSREITVMFTDIVGFSTLSEGMQASEVAAFVNHHFSLVGRCIEEQEGTIDKFIGDAVMAFWGAPDTQQDSAERACRTALAIKAAIHEDNEQRQANALPPVSIRIGVHTGIATVGNIGAPGRLNYTIIGDTVNIGQRLEQLGKELYPRDTEVAILVSDTTANQLGSSFQTVAAGCHRLRGRSEEIEVFKLEAEHAESAS